MICGERFTQARRYLHHCMFYGFLLCFAATCVATLYADILGHDAPYRVLQPAGAARDNLDLESLEDPLESVSLTGKTVPNLPQRELLLILCAHGGKHYWKRLRWLCDVGEMLRTEQDLDWQKLIVRAKGLRCRRILFLGNLSGQGLVER